MTGIAANIACMSAGALVFAGLLFVYLYVFIKKNPLFPVLAVSCLTLILINVAAGLQARFFAEKETLVSILRFKYISGVSFIAVAPLIVYFLTKKNFMKVSFYIFLPLSALTMAVVMTQSFISTTVNVSSGDIMLTYAGGFRLFSAAVLASVLLSIATLFFDAVRTKVRTRRRLLISFLLGGLALFAGGILEARRDLGNEAAALSPFTAGSLFWGAVLLFDIAREFGNNLRTLKGLRSLISKKSFEAIKDPLTSLFNRGYLMEGIHQAIEKLKRHKVNFAVLMLDLDDFKKVNDRHGHQAGDLVLINVAKTLFRNCRAYDVPARYGGEEFIVLISEASPRTSEIVAERLRNGIASLKTEYQGETISVTATIGMIFVDWENPATEDILKEVDEALYEGKAAGKNRVVERKRK